jgi:hypothetical protein
MPKVRVEWFGHIIWMEYAKDLDMIMMTCLETKTEEMWTGDKDKSERIWKGIQQKWLWEYVI